MPHRENICEINFVDTRVPVLQAMSLMLSENQEPSKEGSFQQWQVVETLPFQKYF